MVSLVVLVSLLYPQALGDHISLALMMPVLIYTVWFYIAGQPAEFLLVFAYSVSGVVIGVFLFSAGLLLSSANPIRYITESFSGLQQLGLYRQQLGLLIYQATIILYEEIIWRVFLVNAISIWMPAWVVVIISCVLFWFVHQENRQFGSHSIEFLLFSLVITIAYVITHSLVLVWFIHVSRNLLIVANDWHQRTPAELQYRVDKKD